MKKFLFTLAALLMSGIAFAANVYIADREFTAEEIGTQVWLDVMVQLDNEYMNGWDFTFTFPEGLNVTNAIKKNNAVLTQTAVTDEFGSEENVAFTVNGDAYHSIGACIQGGYWDPDGDGEYEMYGAVKIGPTGDFMLYQIRVKPTEAFTGGNIEIAWMVSGGFDNRNGQTKMQAEGNTTVVLTVAGGAEPEVTEAPVITVVDDPEAQTVTVTATGNGHIIIYWDDMIQAEGEGVAVWVIPYTDDPEGEEYGVSATAQEEGKEVSEYALATVEVPGKPVTPPEPQYLTGEIIIGEPSEDGIVTVTYTGEEEGVEVTVVLNGEAVEGDIQLVEGENTIVVTVTAPGYEPMEETFTVVYTPTPEPVETPAPVINVTETEDAYIIEAVGEGEVILYVNDEPVENPYTIARPEAGEEAIVIYVYATAQNPGEEMGTSDVERIEVAPKEGTGPVDPHMTGYWIVTIDKDGNEVWKELIYDDGDYTGICRFEYGVYGTFDYPDGIRPDVYFYIVVDGVRYGAQADGTLCNLGEALENPLEEGENLYFLQEGVGRVYNMGVAIDPETGDMYVYAAVAGYTDIDEMNADKAVAGVRYFNMAGQEMSKAEGMTIVVTTYTDGTTSAVKVIK